MLLHVYTYVYLSCSDLAFSIKFLCIFFKIFDISTNIWLLFCHEAFDVRKLSWEIEFFELKGIFWRYERILFFYGGEHIRQLKFEPRLINTNRLSTSTIM